MKYAGLLIFQFLRMSLPMYEKWTHEQCLCGYGNLAGSVSREECLGVRASALASRLTRDTPLPVTVWRRLQRRKWLALSPRRVWSYRVSVGVSSWCFLCCVLSSLSAPSIFTGVCLSPLLCCRVSCSGSWEHVQLKSEVTLTLQTADSTLWGTPPPTEWALKTLAQYNL